MRDSLMSVIEDVEKEIGPQEELTAFLTVREAVRESWGSDAALAYQSGAPVTLYSAEGSEYQISFSALFDELLMIAAMETGERLTGRE